MTHSMLAFTSFQLIMAMAIFAICMLLILIILVQKGRGGGLASAFGGGGGGGGAFGAKTGDVFTGITVVLAGVYLLLTVFGNYVFRPVTTNPQTATVQQTSGTNPAPTTTGGGTGAATGRPDDAIRPNKLPPGAIKINPGAGKTSIGEAVEKGEQAMKDAAEETGDALGEAADATGEAIDDAANAVGDAADDMAGNLSDDTDDPTDEDETP